MGCKSHRKKNYSCRLEDSANSLEIISLASYLHSFERNEKEIYSSKLGREEGGWRNFWNVGGVGEFFTNPWFDVTFCQETTNVKVVKQTFFSLYTVFLYNSGGRQLNYEFTE